MFSRASNHSVDMTWFVVRPKSRKRVLTKVAYFTVVLTIEKTPVDSLNGNKKKTNRLFSISVTFSFLLHHRTNIQSKVPERHSQVMKPIIKRTTKNSFTDQRSIDELAEDMTKLKIC